MPDVRSVTIIGGGVIGCFLAYRLALKACPSRSLSATLLALVPPGRRRGTCSLASWEGLSMRKGYSGPWERKVCCTGGSCRPLRSRVGSIRWTTRYSTSMLPWRRSDRDPTIHGGAASA